MELKNKKLLMLGGASYAPYIRKYADLKGFKVYAAGNQPNKTMQQYTDDFYIADASKEDEVCKVVNEYGIDGILSLGNEDIINCAIDVAIKCNVPFFVKREHWTEFQDKQNFKKHCKEFGIDTVEEYDISSETSDQELREIPYPVIFKPSDSCGSQGITVCYDFFEIKAAIKKALSFSRSNRFIVERYMQNPEFIVSYIISDSKVSVWMLGDRHMNTQVKGLGGVSNLSVFPSKYADLYISQVHVKVLTLLKKYGPKNGSLFIQAFIDGDKIRFFDPGLRFCGTLDTILYEEVCGINPLHWMINHALTGEMDPNGEISKMDWNLKGKKAGQLSIHLRTGRIQKIEGLEEIESIPDVINVVRHLEEGNIVNRPGTLQQVMCRVFFVVDNTDDIIPKVEEIYNKISVIDDKGQNMVLPFVLDFQI